MSESPITQIQCPSCKTEFPVEGNFHLNEFANLSPEDLHFLRIFVQSEGKVREMETSLGLSYPTIRTRITELKNKIFSAHQQKERSESIQEILEKLERKEIPFEDAIKAIKKGRKS